MDHIGRTQTDQQKTIAFELKGQSYQFMSGLAKMAGRFMGPGFSIQGLQPLSQVLAAHR